jgi:hypothetical protein
VCDRAALAEVLATSVSGDDGWIRAIGYHDSVAGPLDRAALDALVPTVPLRVQHRSGVLWILNSAGLARVGLAGHTDGRLRSADPSWSAALNRRESSLAEVSSPPESPMPRRISTLATWCGCASYIDAVNCPNVCTVWLRANGSCMTTA